MDLTIENLSHSLIFHRSHSLFKCEDHDKHRQLFLCASCIDELFPKCENVNEIIVKVSNKRFFRSRCTKLKTVDIHNIECSIRKPKRYKDMIKLLDVSVSLWLWKNIPQLVLGDKCAIIYVNIYPQTKGRNNVNSTRSKRKNRKSI